MNTPYGTLAHVGFLALQSTHVLLGPLAMSDANSLSLCSLGRTASISTRLGLWHVDNSSAAGAPQSNSTRERRDAGDGTTGYDEYRDAMLYYPYYEVTALSAVQRVRQTHNARQYIAQHTKASFPLLVRHAIAFDAAVRQNHFTLLLRELVMRVIDDIPEALRQSRHICRHAAHTSMVGRNRGGHCAHV